MWSAAAALHTVTARGAIFVANFTAITFVVYICGLGYFLNVLTTAHNMPVHKVYVLFGFVGYGCTFLLATLFLCTAVTFDQATLNKPMASATNGTLQTTGQTTLDRAVVAFAALEFITLVALLLLLIKLQYVKNSSRVFSMFLNSCLSSSPQGRLLQFSAWKHS